jgi:hypothetical protein
MDIVQVHTRNTDHRGVNTHSGTAASPVSMDAGGRLLGLELGQVAAWERYLYSVQDQHQHSRVGIECKSDMVPSGIRVAREARCRRQAHPSGIRYTAHMGRPACKSGWVRGPCYRVLVGMC